RHRAADVSANSVVEPQKVPEHCLGDVTNIGIDEVEGDAAIVRNARRWLSVRSRWPWRDRRRGRDRRLIRWRGLGIRDDPPVGADQPGHRWRDLPTIGIHIGSWDR